MGKPRSAGPEFPQPDKPQLVKMVDSSSDLFDLVPDQPIDTSTEVSPRVPPQPRRSEAWDDIGNHDGPFVVPVDEDQVFAVHRHSPNPKTSREISRIETNRKFGLAGKVSRTADQDAMVHQAAEQGRSEREQRRIAAGMTPAQARSLRIVEALRRGQDPGELYDK